MNDTSSLLGQAELILRPWAADYTHPEADRLDVLLPPEALKIAVRALQKARWGYFAALTGLDLPAPAGAKPEDGHIEGLYHFCEGAAVLTLRVRLPYARAQVESLCEVIPSALLYEREFSEMYGVDVLQSPMKTRLLLADDWPEDVYPMRKSFSGLQEPPAAEVKVG